MSTHWGIIKVLEEIHQELRGLREILQNYLLHADHTQQALHEAEKRFLADWERLAK